ncbi:MAG: PqqD family protein [Deltaproteobacteria bacterium]|nr:PqqD family protein [Deltaproteobacteria bacterium]MBW2332280.1 PqqD family protein [Deltaproteobacteria bacterium]OPX41380.1 MAG: hypothetical protein B1H13_02370 [Desulfobacteraceae bacterium 4484_190.3]
MSGNFDLNAVPCKDNSIIIRRVKDEAYLVKTDSQKAPEEKLWVLNSMAIVVWQMIDGRRKSRDILHELTERYDAEPDQIKKDFIKLLIELQDQGILTLRSNRQPCEKSL